MSRGPVKARLCVLISARGGGEVWKSELLGAKGAAMVAAKGEGVLEGIVGEEGR